MALIRVFNPKTGPVIFGNGRTIGGGEWLEVEEKDVRDHLARRNLIRADPPVVSTDDGFPPITPVDSVPVESVPETPEIAVTPATIKKPRQRKPPPEKE